MFLDAKLTLSLNQAIASLAAGSDEISDNVVDLGTGFKNVWGDAITPDVGEGGNLEVNASLVAAMVGAGTALDVKLVTKAADSTLTSGGTELAKKTFPAESALGTKLSFHVPAGTVERYIGVVFGAVGGTNVSTTVHCWIGLDHEKTD